MTHRASNGRCRRNAEEVTASTSASKSGRSALVADLVGGMVGCVALSLGLIDQARGVSQISPFSSSSLFALARQHHSGQADRAPFWTRSSPILDAFNRSGWPIDRGYDWIRARVRLPTHRGVVVGRQRKHTRAPVPSCLAHIVGFGFGWTAHAPPSVRFYVHAHIHPAPSTAGAPRLEYGGGAPTIDRSNRRCPLIEMERGPARRPGGGASGRSHACDPNA